MITHRKIRQYGISHQPKPSRYSNILRILLLAYSLAWLLAGCVTSQFDRQHRCAMHCEGTCDNECSIDMEQGGTEVKLPYQ